MFSPAAQILLIAVVMLSPQSLHRSLSAFRKDRTVPGRAGHESARNNIPPRIHTLPRNASRAGLDAMS
jgi:hypothetical protein